MEDQANGSTVRRRGISHCVGRMLIQCHSCNTKYRLNLEQIPRRKTFVRCKSCGTPIFIDATEEEQPASGVIPPPPGTVPPPEPVPPPPDGEPDAAALGGHGPPVASPLPPGQVQVVCPGCAARYRIPEASVRRPGVKLKCTQCGLLFAPPGHLQPPQAAAQPGLAPASPERAPAQPPAPVRAPARAGARQEMPLPDERQMEQLFDDLRPEPVVPAAAGKPAGVGDAELGSLLGEDFAHEPPAPDAEQAYLDSVAFDDEGGAPLATGSVPDEQKFRFFLNPKRFQGSEAGMADQRDDTAMPAPPAAAEPGPETPFSRGPADELPSLEAVPPAAPLPSTEVRGAHSREEMARLREVVPGQAARVFTERRVLTIVAAATILILLGTGAWGYWLAATAGNSRPFQVRVGQPHQLVMKDDLQGRFVTNAPSGKRLFVVNGVVDNRFPGGSTLRWIRIKGAAYVDPTQSRLLGTSFAYAGNVLEDSQIAQWELAAVKAYYGFTNGRKELNVSIASGAKVPFQLVFAELEGGQVGRTVAQVVSYYRDGRAVFIDNP